VNKTRKNLPPFALLAGVLALLTVPVLGAGSAGAAVPAQTAGAGLTASVSLLSFGNATVGDILGPLDVTFTNSGTTTVTVTGMNFGGTDSDDFIEPVQDNCSSLTAGQSCLVEVAFVPGALGARSATLTPATTAANPPVITLEGTGTEGYYEASALGDVTAHGDALTFGDAAGTHLDAPIVASAATGDDGGYWLVASDGGVFTYGDAGFFGSTGNIHLNKPIVGMAATIDDGGYWLVASDGGIFTFGDAGFFGSTGGIHLNEPIVGMAATPDDEGYWLVASDGGIFTFGDAGFYGSEGGTHLNAPIVGMASTPDGGGYWEVAEDGGIFTFGDAPYLGSTGAIHLNEPIVGMAPTPDGGGYWLMAADGGIFTFGDAPFDGSSAGTPDALFISIAGDGPPTLQAILDDPALKHWDVAPHLAHQG
jgi:hypothetical protein